MSQYSDKDIQKALVFMENNINPNTGNPNYSAARKKLGMSRTTLKRMWDEKHSEDGEQIRALKKEEFIKKAWAEILAGLQAMADKRNSANYKEVATSVGILIDKVQLLKGEPTVIAKNENKNDNTERFEHLSDEELKEEIKRLQNV